MLVRLTPVFVLCLAIACLSHIETKPATTSATNRRFERPPPKLSDTLSVAKSPLEPVTSAQTLPGGRNEGLTGEAVTTTTVSPQDLDEERKLTTRSADDQQLSSFSTKGLDESTGLQDSMGAASTTSKVTEKPDELVTIESITSTTEAPIENETKVIESSEEQDETTTTTTTASSSTADVESSEAPASSTTTTTEAPTTTTSTTESPTTSAENKESDAESADQTTSTTAATPTTTELVEETTTSTSTSTSTSTTSTTSTTTTTASTDVPPARTETSESVPAETSSDAPSTDSAEATSPQTTTTSQPETTEASTPAEIQHEQASTTTQAPEVPTSESAVSSTTEAAKPVPESSPKPTVTSESDNDKASSCDHLPTYSSDEIQKVFREETTFKNGTIKGKFTYINFDQRYRLVHYTRLPYGPVKIDQVEELGRPKQNGSNGSQSVASTLNDVPNAVLQLRNLLPNSLFGFPFLSPNSAHLKPREGDDDKSNMYFYSTDSLATPNLLSPRVPVSLLPGQRVKISQPVAPSSASVVSDSLSRRYHEQSSAAGSKPFGMPMAGENKPSDLNEPANQQHNVHQFHYANSMSSSAHADLPKSFVYSYYGSHQVPPVQYQYASLPPPVPLFHQPIHGHHLGLDPQTLPIQAHQPHSHEHFMSQYMLSQPVEDRSAKLNDSSKAQQQSLQSADSSRLRIRVKSSKSLNVGQGTKSAPLRLQPSDGHYSSPANSARQQRHRLGKQNHQLNSMPGANRSPVVYHVLRSPTGRVYTQYNQGYAVAYDHK